MEAIDIYSGGRLSRPYRPKWQQFAAVLGTKPPWWHYALCDQDAILAWKPDAPPAAVPACDVELPTEALTALAADEPDGSPAAEVCLWLARHLRHQATASARDYMDLVKEAQGNGGDSAWLTLGAVPTQRYRPDPEPPPEVVRRAGWLQIIERRDTLAARVADIARRWDSGSDWAAGVFAEVFPGECVTAVEWAGRLVAAATDQPPTVLERELLAHISSVDTGTLLHDPVTDLPAVHRVDHVGEECVIAAVPQRLSATAPLTSVTLSAVTVWVRTADDGLWIALQHPGNGLSWGYNGGGPTALAILLNRLLDDITAEPVDSYDPRPPAGLERLIEATPQEGSTTYTLEWWRAADGQARLPAAGARVCRGVVPAASRPSRAVFHDRRRGP